MKVSNELIALPLDVSKNYVVLTNTFGNNMLAESWLGRYRYSIETTKEICKNLSISSCHLVVYATTDLRSTFHTLLGVFKSYPQTIFKFYCTDNLEVGESVEFTYAELLKLSLRL